MEKTAALKGELIGKEAEVVEASGDAQKGIRGKIVDETRNTLTIMNAEGKKKKLIKNTVAIKIGSIIIRGEEIHAAPEERIKIKRK